MQEAMKEGTDIQQQILRAFFSLIGRSVIRHLDNLFSLF